MIETSLHYGALAQVFRDSKQDCIAEFEHKFFVIKSKSVLQSFSTNFSSLKVRLHCRALAQVFPGSKEDSIAES